MPGRPVSHGRDLAVVVSSPSRGGYHHPRGRIGLNFSGVSDDRIVTGMTRLAGLLRERLPG